MIASSIGNCKCFNKLDQSRIDVARGGAPRCAIKHFSHPFALHLGRMLRAAEGGQGDYASIVKLDMVGDKTDRLSENYI